MPKITRVSIWTTIVSIVVTAAAIVVTILAWPSGDDSDAQGTTVEILQPSKTGIEVRSGRFYQVVCAERSLMSARLDATSCVETSGLNLIDPCFELTRTHVACPRFSSDPFSSLESWEVTDRTTFGEGFRDEGQRGIDAVVNLTYPWAVQLYDDTWCYLAVTGAEGLSVERRTYSCGPAFPIRYAGDPYEYFNGDNGVLVRSLPEQFELYSLTRGDIWTAVSTQGSGSSDVSVKVKRVVF